MIDEKKLDDLAGKLMFKMSKEEYATLEKEFAITIKQMNLLSNIKGLKEVEPMFYPFDLELDDSYLREDDYHNEIDFNDVKVNAKEYEGSKVKVPKVVE